MDQTLRSFSLALPVFGGEEGGLPAVDADPPQPIATVA